jgi:uncharacterized protein YhfF
MEKIDISIKKMWEDYLNYIGENINDSKKEYTSWHFCDNKKDANDLAALVNDGIKRATTSLNYFYEKEEEELPKKDEFSIITDWEGIAICIIKTENIRILPFNEVTEEFAYREGEGDKSLKYWRKAHIEAFGRELNEYNLKFSEDMLVVCEEFEKIY